MLSAVVQKKMYQAATRRVRNKENFQSVFAVTLRRLYNHLDSSTPRSSELTTAVEVEQHPTAHIYIVVCCAPNAAGWVSDDPP
jgi:hypothetical protein